MGFDAFNVHEHAFNLGRKHVNPPDDDHVVGPAGHLFHSHEGSAAHAWLGMERGDVAGAVANERIGLLAEGGEDQLAARPIGKRLSRFRVDDFSDEVILEQVQPGLPFDALVGHPRTNHLGEPVGVDGINIETLLQRVSHVARPGFRAEAPGSKLKIHRGIKPHVLRHLGEMKGVGRRAGKDRGAKVLHDGYLPLAVAPGRGDDRGADFFRPVVKSHASGKKSVGVCVMNDVAPVNAGAGETAGHELRPKLNIMAGVAHHHGLARRS